MFFYASRRSTSNRKKIAVRIPDTLSDSLVKPAGDLVIAVKKPDGMEIKRVSFRADPESRREGQSMVFHFTPTGTSKMTYAPGDQITVELPVKKGERDWKLSWLGSRTLSFQFERLMREPRLHDAKTPATEGVLADGIGVQILEGTWPMVPALLPSAKLAAK